MGDCFCETCCPEKHRTVASTDDSWDLTSEERGSFLWIATLLRDPEVLDDAITKHDTRNHFRRACEKLMARADSRQVMTTAERELAYLKERIHNAKGWLKFGMTHKLWGSITDGYSELDNGRVPPVKTWQAAGGWIAEGDTGLVVTAPKTKAKKKAKRKSNAKAR